MTFVECEEVTTFTNAFKFSNIRWFNEFRWFTNIRSVSFNSDYSFYNCTLLKSIIIPRCNEIDMGAAFGNCSSLKYMRFEGFKRISNSWLYENGIGAGDKKGLWVSFSADCKTFNTRSLRLERCHKLTFEHMTAPFSGNNSIFGSTLVGYINSYPSNRGDSKDYCYVPVGATGYDVGADWQFLVTTCNFEILYVL